MPFGMVGRTGPWIRQVVGFRDRSTGRGNFGKYAAPIVTNGDFLLLGIPIAMLVLGEFLELQARRAGEACRLNVRCG